MKAPAFQFYPAAWLASLRVQMMTLEEEGAYIRLLCYCWLHGSIPDDTEQIARIIGKGASTNVATNVKRMFDSRCDSVPTLINERLEVEREKQAGRRKQTSDAGKKSAESRKKVSENQRTFNETSNSRCDSVQRESNPLSLSLDKEEDSEKREEGTNPIGFVGEAPVSLDTVKANCGQFGGTPDMAEQWWLKNNASGWIMPDGRPMAHWQSSLQKWNNSWRANDFSRKGTHSKSNPPKGALDQAEERREIEESNARLNAPMAAAAIRIQANAEWLKADPANRGPKPYPQPWERDSLFDDEEGHE